MDPKNEAGVVARIRIGASWPVRADSEAQLEPIGLTGLNLIQISSGTETKPRLVQRMGEGPPRIKAKGAAIDELLASSSTIAQNATEALAGARDMMTAENAQRVERILANLEKISRDLAAERGAVSSLAGAADEWRLAARQLTSTAREIELLSADTRGRLANIETGATAALGNINQAAISLDGAATAASSGAIPDLSNAANDMRRLAVTLDRVAGNVERSRALSAVGEQKRTVRVAP
jgi:phospholipid/cholesterol/gamma-HCH transport system substrate-binding protein